MKLAELQKAFQSYLTHSSDSAESEFVKPELGELSERLAIYKNAYYLRLVGTLKLNYAVLQKYLGVPRFNKLAVEYLAHYPSRFYSIRSVGSLIPEFLAEHYPAEPAWRELAELEWKLEGALYAADAAPLLLDDLRRLSPEEWPELVLSLHPSVRFQVCSYNIPESWVPLNSDDACAIKLRQHSELMHYIVWRKEQHSCFYAINAAENRLLQLLQQPQNFASLCEAMAHDLVEEGAIAEVSRFLQRWIGQGFLVRSFS